MDRVRDKSAKIAFDANDKPATTSKGHNDCTNEQSKLVLTPKICCYCPKAFINSAYLLKHILRRHSEDFLIVHRKCAKQETNNLVDVKYLTDCMKNEFYALRKELLVRESQKARIKDFNQNNETVSSYSLAQLPTDAVSNNEETTVNPNPTGESPSKIICQGTNTIIQDKRISSEKYSEFTNEIKLINDELNKLHALIEHDIVLKKDVNNHLTDSENKILQVQNQRLIELKVNVERELCSKLSKKLNDLNANWGNQFFELNQEVENLTFIVDLMRERINSADFLKEIEKRLETQVVKFLEKGSEIKKIPKQTVCENLEKYNDQTSGDFSRSNLSSSLQNMRKTQEAAHKVLNNKFTTPSQHSTFPSGKFIRKDENKHQEVAFNNTMNRTPYICSDEISSFVNAKMLSLGITPSKPQVSSKEFIEKMKELEDARNSLCTYNPDFIQTYDYINTYVEKKMQSKFKNKNRKLRFSEPLSKKHDIHKYSTNFKKHYHTYPSDEHSEQSPFESAALKKILKVTQEKQFLNFPKVSMLQENLLKPVESRGFLLNETVNSDYLTEDSPDPIKAFVSDKYGQWLHSTPVIGKESKPLIVDKSENNTSNTKDFTSSVSSSTVETCSLKNNSNRTLDSNNSSSSRQSCSKIMVSKSTFKNKTDKGKESKKILRVGTSLKQQKIENDLSAVSSLESLSSLEDDDRFL